MVSPLFWDLVLEMSLNITFSHSHCCTVCRLMILNTPTVCVLGERYVSDLVCVLMKVCVQGGPYNYVCLSTMQQIPI